MMLRVADAAKSADAGAWRTEFLQQKEQLAEIFMANTLGRVKDYAHQIHAGAKSTEAITAELLSA